MLPLIQGTQARIRDKINLPLETTSEAPSRLQNKLRDFILCQSNQRQGGEFR